MTKRLSPRPTATYLLIALFGLPLGGGAYAEATATETSAEADIEQRSEARDDLPSLAEVLGAEDDEAFEALSERCLQTSRIRSHQVLDEQHIVFRMRNGDHYLTRLPRRCVGLRWGNAIRLDVRGNRLCRLDTIRALPRDSFSIDPGVPCMVQGFQQVTPEQVEYLREGLKRQRRR